jgi:hypothetical protein
MIMNGWYRSLPAEPLITDPALPASLRLHLLSCDPDALAALRVQYNLPRSIFSQSVQQQLVPVAAYLQREETPALVVLKSWSTRPWVRCALTLRTHNVDGLARSGQPWDFVSVSFCQGPVCAEHVAHDGSSCTRAGCMHA